MKNQNLKKGEIVIYKSADKQIQLEVRLDKDTVWLSQKQMAALFDKNTMTINEHIKNTYKERELQEASTIRKSLIVQKEGARAIKREILLYNLDVIISVGYRVKSFRGTQFRIWATRTLKDHLLKGYTINQKRLLQANNQLQDLQETISFLKEKAKHKLLSGQEQEILSLLADYSKTLSILDKYDKDQLAVSKNGKGKYVLTYEQAVQIVAEIKKELFAKKEASDLFGQEYHGKLSAILGGICQTFDKKELYPSIEEKAAHLLYFTIKDHPFADGNKRIASFLFVYFLDKNKYLHKKSGEKKINDNALTALALLIAISDPKEKSKMIKIITNLLST